MEGDIERADHCQPEVALWDSGEWVLLKNRGPRKATEEVERHDGCDIGMGRAPYGCGKEVEDLSDLGHGLGVKSEVVCASWNFLVISTYQ